MASTRAEASDATKFQIWGAAAGRCHLCNQLVLGNEDLGVLITIGEIAHIVGATDGPKSPRGQSELTHVERAEFDNLLLLCSTCHKSIDDRKVVGKFTVERLKQFKIEHEKWVETVTSARPTRNAHVLRLVGNIRGSSPELSFDTVQSAALVDGMFPERLPGAYRSEIEIDLRGIPNEGTAGYYAQCRAVVDQQVQRVGHGIAADDVKRLAVFGFARIPLLVYFGAQLDDKIKTHLFQLQRNGSDNGWIWQAEPDDPVEFRIRRENNDTDQPCVALVINLSGTVGINDLPAEVVNSSHLYILEPSLPSVPGPELFSSRGVLTSFSRTIREFLARVEKSHGRVEPIALFGAIPVSAAVELGRVLMPNVSPGWHVYDRDASGQFSLAMEVVR